MGLGSGEGSDLGVSEGVGSVGAVGVKDGVVRSVAVGGGSVASGEGPVTEGLACGAGALHAARKSNPARMN